jgi:predicted DNA-binding transcriptional regulator AlpA
MTIAESNERVDLESPPPTIDLVTAARLLGIGRTVAYELVRDGRWPTPIIHAGRKIRVPTTPLLILLGLSPGRQRTV